MATPSFELRSFVTQSSEGAGGSYQLELTNRGEEAVRSFRLGFSGPGRIGEGVAVAGGTITQQLSNWCEIASPQDLVLEPNATWTIEIERTDFPLRHWTDGATTGMVALADGRTVLVRTVPTGLGGRQIARRRGVARLKGTGGGPHAIIPWPNHVDTGGMRSAPHGFAIRADEPAGKAAAQSFTKLVEALFPGEGLARPEEEGGFPVVLEPAGELGPEAYAIAFAPHEARVRAAGPTGFLYGLITLGQMARGARAEPLRFSFPSEGNIEDAPHFAWRGSHLDVARRFYGSGEVAQFLRILAWNKLNRLHWHLSDDEAWRVEIEAFPELTKRAAFRGAGFAIPPLLGSGPEPEGGFYSKANIRGLVGLGQGLGIEIVPEVDVPGHCYALLAALPSLRDPGENGLYRSIQGFPNNCLNPGHEAVYEALETIFSEMVELFPSAYFHVGADEVPEDAWATSPMARELGARLGGSETARLQAEFLQRIQRFLGAKGKITGAWEEAAHGGGIGKEDSYLVGWTTIESNRRLAGEGYDVVAAPAQCFYLDMALSAEFEEPGAGWAGFSSLENSYGFDPAEGWNAAERAHLMGVQACIWSEPMTDRAVFDRLVFPRLSAIAETGWTEKGRKHFGRFAATANLMPSLYGSVESTIEG